MLSGFLPSRPGTWRHCAVATIYWTLQTPMQRGEGVTVVGLVVVGGPGFSLGAGLLALSPAAPAFFGSTCAGIIRRFSASNSRTVSTSLLPLLHHGQKDQGHSHQKSKGAFSADWTLAFSTTDRTDRRTFHCQRSHSFCRPTSKHDESWMFRTFPSPGAGDDL